MVVYISIVAFSRCVSMKGILHPHAFALVGFLITLTSSLAHSKKQLPELTK